MPLLRDLSRRDRQPELMDDPALAESLHRQALRGLERVNRISGISSLLWRSIRPLCDADPSRTVRVFDVGCGGGDISVGVWRKAQRAGYNVQIGGCDISPKALRMSSERARAAGADAEYVPVDILNDPLPRGWDVMYCSLFLHHFDEPSGIRLLTNMAQSVERMVLVDDLIRDRLGYFLCWWGVRLLTRSPIVHVDGPLSVRAGFQPREVLDMAARSGMRDARITTHWPQRLLMTWNCPRREGEAPAKPL
ncbi:MAG: methyltransferase domain-containing protein [Planctomycetaceae bacterium]|nr:methyltransferase domain-containing protein [Planctomycetaceae bacterium]